MNGHRDRTGWRHGDLTVVGNTGRRYRGEVIWECLHDDGRTFFNRSSKLTKIYKAASR